SGVNAHTIWIDGSGEVGIGTLNVEPDTRLEVVGTVSGSQVYANDSLSSSGALVVEGISTFNDEVTFGSGIIINGVTYVFPTSDGSASGKVLATDGNGNLSWTAAGGGGSTYYGGQGISINGSNFITLTSTLTGTSLEIYGTASGRNIHAQDSLTSSGGITAEGDSTFNGNVSIGAGAPTELFEVRGTNGNPTQGAILVDNSGMDVTIGQLSSTAGKSTTFQVIDRDGTARLEVLSSSDVILGTNYNLFIESSNENVGIGTATPTEKLEIIGTASGRKLFAMDSLASSGNLVIESSAKLGSGAVTVTAATYQTGAYLYSSGSAVLALNSYSGTQSGSNTHIAFGYRDVFDTQLYRTGRRGSGGLVVRTQQVGSNSHNAFAIVTQNVSADNTIFKVRSNGTVTADGSITGGGADYAEWFYSDKPIKKGEVVCIDVKKDNAVQICDDEADANLMGIASTNPAFIGNAFWGVDGVQVPKHYLIGLIGQLPTKVIIDNYNGGPLNIRPGDPLTSAKKHGYARRALPGEPTVGVALEGFSGKVGERGEVNVLVSRRNSSLTVDQVESEVLDQIASMEIDDEVQIMVADAVENIDLDEEIAEGVKSQFDKIDLKAAVLKVLEDKEEEEAQGAPSEGEAETGTGQVWLIYESLKAQILELENTVSVLSGAQIGRAPNYDSLAIEETLITGGDTRVGGDLFIDGALSIEDLFLSGLLKIDGSIDVGGTLKAASLDLASGATIRGPLNIEGQLLIQGEPFDLSALVESGATMNLSNLVVAEGLQVLGDVTIAGALEVLSGAIIHGDLTLSGSLILSNDQAGYAVVVKTGTSVLVSFGSGTYPSIPIITASADDFVAWRITEAKESGFTIEINE
ncbi:MAG: hypothetical protein QF815_01055, partial [Candidatus Peribacteraceae bacterium]|nr:hypothetical protein [Candidatus Peribacteraceae bacterium]